MLKTVSKLFFISILLFLHACAARHAAMPSYEGTDAQKVLSSNRNISSMEMILSITFEKGDNETKRGNGILHISRTGDLHMRLYSLGFLAFEMTSENGVLKSSRALDRSKGLILSYGLRNCLFWWDLRDFEVLEKEDSLIFMNHERELWLDKKTAFPKKQTISLEDGRELNIFYDDQEKTGEIWYPSTIRIEFARYTVTLKVKEVSFVREG